MKRVCKWTVPVDDEVHLIGNGKVVFVGCQYGPNSVQVWTEEAAVAPHATRPVAAFGTGHEIPDSSRHVGTAVTAGGSLVWHVFEVRETT